MEFDFVDADVVDLDQFFTEILTKERDRGLGQLLIRPHIYTILITFF